MPAALLFLRLALVSAFVVMLGWWVFDQIGVHLPAISWVLILGVYAGLWVVGLVGLAWLAIRRKSHRYQLRKDGVLVGGDLVKWDRLEGYAVLPFGNSDLPELVLRRHNGSYIRRPLPNSPRQQKVVQEIARHGPQLRNALLVESRLIPLSSRVGLLLGSGGYTAIGAAVLLWLQAKAGWRVEAAMVASGIAIWLGPGTLWFFAHDRAWRRSYPKAARLMIGANLGVWTLLLCVAVAIDIAQLRKEGNWPLQSSTQADQLAQ